MPGQAAEQQEAKQHYSCSAMSTLTKRSKEHSDSARSTKTCHVRHAGAKKTDPAPAKKHAALAQGAKQREGNSTALLNLERFNCELRKHLMLKT